MIDENSEFYIEKENLYKELIERKIARPQDVLNMVKSMMIHGKMDFIKENMSNIAELTSLPIETLQLLNMGKIDTTVYKEIINTRKDAVVKEMLNQTVSGIDCEKSEETVELITMMIDEVVKNENLNFYDIKPITRGGYSMVFRVGEKVVKIGKLPEKYQIPRNSKRFLQPITRYKFNAMTDKHPVDFGFEIAERCETNCEFSLDEIYQVYKDIREQGMVWTDCKPANLGKLKKDNIVHLPSFKGVKKTHHSRVGFEEDNDVDILPAGETVLLDLDYVFNANDPNMIVPLNSLYDSLEKRYRNEQREMKKEMPSHQKSEYDK